MGGDAEVGGALEDGDGLGLLRDDGDGLDAGGAGADDADALAGEVDAFVGPFAGVDPVAFEGVEAGEVWEAGDGEAAGAHDAEARGEAVALVGFDVPAGGGVVVVGCGDAGFELHAAAEIEFVCDEAGVFEDFGLGGVALAPVPFLLDFVGEGELVGEAFDVAPGAGVAVPVPGTADVCAGFDDL